MFIRNVSFIAEHLDGILKAQEAEAKETAKYQKRAQEFLDAHKGVQKEIRWAYLLKAYPGSFDDPGCVDCIGYRKVLIFEDGTFYDYYDGDYPAFGSVDKMGIDDEDWVSAEEIPEIYKVNPNADNDDVWTVPLAE